MKHSLLLFIYVVISQLTAACGHEEPSSQPTESGSGGSASLSIALDSDGNVSMGSFSIRDPRVEVVLGDSGTKSSKNNREFTFFSSKEASTEGKHKDDPKEKDQLARVDGDNYGEHDGIPEAVVDTTYVISNEKYESLEDAEKSFDTQLKSATEGMSKAYETAKPFLEQVKPILSAAAFAHNDDIQKTIALSADVANTAAGYAGTFKTSPMTFAGAKLVRASSELKKAWKELPNRFTGNELGYKSNLLKAAGSAIDLADVMFARGDQDQGEYLLKVGQTMIDAALGFVPIVGWVKDVSEAITGYNMILDRPLTPAERAIAVVGAVTGGLGSQVVATGKTLKTINAFFIKTNAGEEALQAVIRASQMLGH
jgi:hypothetical protein